MITSLQFDNALKIIVDYKLQLERGSDNESIVIQVDIQDKISKNTFFTLQLYYSDILEKKLEWNDLKAMDIEQLKSIDFIKLRRYRGFGAIAEFKLLNVICLSSKISDILPNEGIRY
jgi:hypothetical protein